MLTSIALVYCSSLLSILETTAAWWVDLTPLPRKHRHDNMSQKTSLRACHSWWVSTEQSIIVTFSALTYSKILLVPLSGNRKKKKEKKPHEYAEGKLRANPEHREALKPDRLRHDWIDSAQMCLWNTLWKARQTQSGASLSCGPTWWPVAYPRCPLAIPLPFLNLVNVNTTEHVKALQWCAQQPRRGETQEQCIWHWGSETRKRG